MTDTHGSGEAEQIAARRAKLERLRAAGYAFPNDFKRSREPDGQEHDAATLRARYGEYGKDALAAMDLSVAVAGRLMNVRGPFRIIRDGSGTMQLYLSRHAPAALREAVESWDIGDIVAGSGQLEKSGRGDLYVDLAEARLLTKALRPLPGSEYYGIADQELKYRRRYLDLIMSEETRTRFVLRTRIISAFRRFLSERGFLEVETPMMHPIPGGATARPFITHHNALDMDLYLRVAPELYLKRLIVGGFERVFELGRNFRNEGLSPKHNPEFTMLEFYQAYATFEDLMDFSGEMLRFVLGEALGTTSVTFAGQSIDFGAPIPRRTVREMLVERAGVPDAIADDVGRLRAYARERNLAVPDDVSLGSLQFGLFEALVEEHITDPVFVTHLPTDVSPLARRNAGDPGLTDRFELFVMGREIANGFSELNDADDQAERFRRQVAARDAGDQEAMHYDADYVRALEYGMPPTAGEGVGIDRLVMLLTGSTNIRDVLLFPHMRPEAGLGE